MIIEKEQQLSSFLGQYMEAINGVKFFFFSVCEFCDPQKVSEYSSQKKWKQKDNLEVCLA